MHLSWRPLRKSNLLLIWPGLLNFYNVAISQTITGTSKDRHDISNHRKILLFVQTFVQETPKLHITDPLWG